ncbi:alpha-amylase A-like [Phlebotomus argentipes]|uniref:alpha-amylase A-like n=1 Tax=Phlebotomus argentipes TaxID=94469 RepID=UPI002892E80F|nr:alpha-amylase A-like [Phlebotomus argentipes]
MKFFLFSIPILIGLAQGQFDPNYVPDRNVIVHLFQWKYTDIANECENFLGPNGFAGIQIDSPAENVIVTEAQYSGYPDRPWWERYQIVSYKLDQTRAGSYAELADMISRCNAAGVRIYADAVFNHMAGLGALMEGTAGSTGNSVIRSFPDVPYIITHFHIPCGINDYNDANQVRNCDLVGAPDLNQALSYVRGKIIDYLNSLIGLGVAGFRIDSAKHIWPQDLQAIASSLADLNTAHGFAPGSRPFIYQEVINVGPEAVSKYEYTDIGDVTEFLYSVSIGGVFKKFEGHHLSELANWGQPWGFLPSNRALVFVENHDNERGHGAGGDLILTYKDGKVYRMAVSFGLAHPYGVSRIMSSYDFTDTEVGPPMDANQDVISPSINPDGSCGNGWVCQHRWHQIYSMVRFKNVVKDAELSNWWSNGNNQIAFARSGRGFVAFNNEGSDMSVNLQTSLPAGTYCDVISGGKDGTSCTGKSVVVQDDGTADIVIGAAEDDGVLAIHIDEKL